MFRRRPGRLLNILYAFNLRPVSTGYLVNLLVEEAETAVKGLPLGNENYVIETDHLSERFGDN